MAITEESRHRMYQRLEELLGRDEAATLMEHLPPVGWADVATKRDVDGLAAATRRDIENMANVLRAEFAHGLNRQTIALMASNTALVALALTAAKLL